MQLEKGKESVIANPALAGSEAISNKNGIRIKNLLLIDKIYFKLRYAKFFVRNLLCIKFLIRLFRMQLKLFEPGDFLTFKEASEWASEHLKKKVTASNIAYLVNYARIHKYGENGETFVSKNELTEYYKSFNGSIRPLVTVANKAFKL